MKTLRLEIGTPNSFRKASIPSPKSEMKGVRRVGSGAKDQAALNLIADTQRFAPFVICHSSFVVLLCLLTCVLCLPVFAQSYSINWHTIDGGGGTSTGGVYSVSGTIGQPDPSTTMTGGEYSLTSGFWSLIVIQAPGAPALLIVPAAPGQASISWTPGTPGFVLQETRGISPTNWVDSPSGANNPVTVPVSDDAKFYRLSKP